MHLLQNYQKSAAYAVRIVYWKWRVAVVSSYPCVFVCVCVCMCVCMYVCVHACVFIAINEAILLLCINVLKIDPL
jgi:hypothetical protein